MPRFNKRPVVIEAHLWLKNGDHPLDGDDPSAEGQIVRYFRSPETEEAGGARCKHCGQTFQSHGWIDTLEGGHKVCPGDWIITGVEGENYPCKPSIFRKTYDLIQETPAPREAKESEATA